MKKHVYFNLIEQKSPKRDLFLGQMIQTTLRQTLNPNINAQKTPFLMQSYLAHTSDTTTTAQEDEPVVLQKKKSILKVDFKNKYEFADFFNDNLTIEEWPDFIANNRKLIDKLINHPKMLIHILIELEEKTSSFIFAYGITRFKQLITDAEYLLDILGYAAYSDRSQLLSALGYKYLTYHLTPQDLFKLTRTFTINEKATFSHMSSGKIFPFFNALIYKGVPDGEAEEMREPGFKNVSDLDRRLNQVMR
jgi:hypothetical protein